MAMLAGAMGIPSGQLPADEYDSAALASEERVARAREQSFDGSPLRQLAAGPPSQQGGQSARADYMPRTSGGAARPDFFGSRREGAPPPASPHPPTCPTT